VDVFTSFGKIKMCDIFSGGVNVINNNLIVSLKTLDKIISSGENSIDLMRLKNCGNFFVGKLGFQGFKAYFDR